VRERPLDSLVALACGSQKVIITTATDCVNKPIPAWEKLKSSLYEHGRGQSRTPPSVYNALSSNVYMMKGDAYILTRAHDYGKPSTYDKGTEAKIPSLPL
jgi:hypothetical protein